MGMSSGGNKGGVQSEINVTPLIDVLLVLLIIFLVVMPIMMKMETLEIPRKIDDNTETVAQDTVLLTVKVKASGDLMFIDGDKDPVQMAAADLLRQLRPKLEAAVARAQDRVVFVDFEEGCNWGQVVTTMDSIRSLASDVNHDEVKVALKLKEEPKAQ